MNEILIIAKPFSVLDLSDLIVKKCLFTHTHSQKRLTRETRYFFGKHRTGIYMLTINQPFTRKLCKKCKCCFFNIKPLSSSAIQLELVVKTHAAFPKQMTFRLDL